MGLISAKSLTRSAEMLKITAHETLKNRGGK
jgi:hypothetical protein